MTSLSLYTCTTLYIIFLTPFLFLPLLIHLLPFLSLSLSLSLPISLYLLLSYIPNKIDPRLSIMIRDFLQRRKESEGGKGKDIVMMEQPELSLAPSFSTNFNYVTGDNNLKFKGKQQLQMYNHGSETTTHEDLELQLCDPLPLDWEQCLDLKSGRMYYVNRKTLKKTWTRPKDLDLNLDLNISAYPDSDDNGGYTSPNPYPNRQHSWSGSHGSSGDSDSDGMVAVVCVNCHLLVMLSKASPYCPNCKFLHSPNIETVKSLETLSLLH